MPFHNASHFFARMGLLASCGVAALSPTSAQANPLAMIVIIPAQTVIAMSATNMLCIKITYDENGNRLSQTASSVTLTETVWGTATYGCFVWKQSN